MNRNNQLLAVLIFTLLACFASDAHAVYHPKLGRWMQQDPLGRDTTMQQRLGTSAMPDNAFTPRDNLAPTPAGGYHDGMNVYDYVGSSPIAGVDPLGLWTKPARKGGARAETVSEEGDTVKKLASRIRLSPDEYKKWLGFKTPFLVTAKGEIRVSWTLEADDVLCPGQTVDVPNTVVVAVGPPQDGHAVYLRRGLDVCGGHL